MNDKNEAFPEERDENAIIAERRAKLAAIREKGVAFPNDFSPRTRLLICMHSMVVSSARCWKRKISMCLLLAA
jgi:hypothetical protein